MIMDAFLVMVDTLTLGTVTSAVLTTDWVDTVAVGDDYAGCFINFVAETAILSGTAGATVTFTLLNGTSTSTITTALVSSGPIDDALVVAGYRYSARIPNGALRYLRGQCQMTGTGATSGTYSCFITKDVPVNRQLVA